MQINITLDGSEGPQQLDAIGALIDVLAGRGPRTEIRSGAASISVHEQLEGEQLVDAALQLVDHSDEDAEIVSAAVAAGAPDRDSAGIPWDARIHSASRATVADGTWRRRKNTPDELFESVMTELRGAEGNVPSKLEVAPVADVPPPPPSTTPEPPVADTAPVEAAATSAADALDLSTWPKFVQAVQAKDVPETCKTYDALNELSATFGATKFLEMRDKTAQWTMFYDMVG